METKKKSTIQPLSSLGEDGKWCCEKKECQFPSKNKIQKNLGGKTVTPAPEGALNMDVQNEPLRYGLCSNKWTPRRRKLFKSQPKKSLCFGSKFNAVEGVL